MILLLVLLIILLCGGWGWGYCGGVYRGPYGVGGSVAGLIILIVILFWLLGPLRL